VQEFDASNLVSKFKDAMMNGIHRAAGRKDKVQQESQDVFERMQLETLQQDVRLFSFQAIFDIVQFCIDNAKYP